MVITRKLYRVTLEGSISYNIAANSIDEAISIIRKWRKDCNIISISRGQDIVLTKEDVQ